MSVVSDAFWEDKVNLCNLIEEEFTDPDVIDRLVEMIQDVYHYPDLIDVERYIYKLIEEK